MASGSIADGTRTIRFRLSRLKDADEGSALDIDGWLERQLLLVDLWIAVAGVYARGPHSIKYRLRKNVAFSQAFLQMLEALNKNAALRWSPELFLHAAQCR